MRVGSGKFNTRENALRQTFVKLLVKFPLIDVKISNDKVSLQFFGNKISDKVVIKREDHVADWSRRRKEIFIDKKITEEDRKNHSKRCVFMK